MINSEPVIEILRSEKTISVKAIIQTWNKLDGNGHICIAIPFLGDIITHAMNEQDAEQAVSEAFHCFVLVSEKFGMGLENELEFIGWKKQESEDKNHTIFVFESSIPVFNSIIDTGDTRVLQFAS